MGFLIRFCLVSGLIFSSAAAAFAQDFEEGEPEEELSPAELLEEAVVSQFSSKASDKCELPDEAAQCSKSYKSCLNKLNIQVMASIKQSVKLPKWLGSSAGALKSALSSEIDGLIEDCEFQLDDGGGDDDGEGEGEFE